MSLLDVLVILAVLALLLFAASREFALYGGRTLSPPTTATSHPER